MLPGLDGGEGRRGGGGDFYFDGSYKVHVARPSLTVAAQLMAAVNSAVGMSSQPSLL